MRVKVCGMTEIDQVRQLDAMGVDFTGFIFYPKSPRYVVRHLTGEQVKKAKLRLGKVGVFVNATYDEVMKQVDSYGLDMVQLHGDETPRFCEQLSNYITVIKVFRLGEDDPELGETIREFRAEEVEHRETALAAGAEQAPAYPFLSAAIRLGCRIAIGLSERI